VLLGVQRIVHSMMEPCPLDDEPLMQAGLDSLGAMELQRRLSEVPFSQRLPYHVLFTGQQRCVIQYVVCHATTEVSIS
jgi:Phosphopantetheine attachment site